MAYCISIFGIEYAVWQETFFSRYCYCRSLRANANKKRWTGGKKMSSGKRAKKHFGWFVFTVSGLMVGDKNIVKEYNNIKLKDIFSICVSLRSSGFARCSRRGWWTLEHPQLGMVQWKEGVDFRNAKKYFYLRINGKPILSAKEGWRPKWTAETAKALSEEDRASVEAFLDD